MHKEALGMQIVHQRKAVGARTLPPQTRRRRTVLWQRSVTIADPAIGAVVIRATGVETAASARHVAVAGMHAVSRDRKAALLAVEGICSTGAPVETRALGHRVAALDPTSRPMQVVVRRAWPNHLRRPAHTTIARVSTMAIVSIMSTVTATSMVIKRVPMYATGASVGPVRCMSPATV